MLKIATHDSQTGEKGHGFLSWLVTPFAKTQRKTLKEQYYAGCRNFDMRFKLTKRGWVCAHGCWTTERTAVDIMEELNSYPERVMVLMTYEGGNENNEAFKEFALMCHEKYNHIIYGATSVKYGNSTKPLVVEYSFLIDADKEYRGGEQAFLPLDGKTWHIILPIPWFWWYIYNRNPEFNETTYRFVDFL